MNGSREQLRPSRARSRATERCRSTSQSSSRVEAELLRIAVSRPNEPHCSPRDDRQPDFATRGSSSVATGHQPRLPEQPERPESSECSGRLASPVRGSQKASRLSSTHASRRFAARRQAPTGHTTRGPTDATQRPSSYGGYGSRTSDPWSPVGPGCCEHWNVRTTRGATRGR
jgi:hypothetical protein